jgi:parvulin-like peptidyl-prolyl isomerase
VTAKREGIAVDKNELENEYTRLKSRYTEATFQKMLELKGISYDQWKEDKRRALLVEKLLDRDVVSQIAVTDGDIKKYYNRHKKDFSHGDEVHARQILVDDLKLAEGIRVKALAGENFAALAQEHSIAPEGKRGGDLGWFQRGIMPKAFDEACFPLPTGEISPIVKTEFGYHIYKVIERRQSASARLEEVKDKIVARIRQEKIEEAFAKWYDAARRDVNVEVNEDALKKISIP